MGRTARSTQNVLVTLKAGAFTLALSILAAIADLTCVSPGNPYTDVDNAKISMTIDPLRAQWYAGDTLEIGIDIFLPCLIDSIHIEFGDGLDSVVILSYDNATSKASLSIWHRYVVCDSVLVEAIPWKKGGQKGVTSSIGLRILAGPPRILEGKSIAASGLPALEGAFRLAVRTDVCGPASRQWLKDGSVLPDSPDKDTLVFGALAHTDTGSYEFTITNEFGSDTSEPYRLSLTAACYFGVTIQGNGTVTPDAGYYRKDTVVNVEAIESDTDYVFDSWSGDLSGEIRSQQLTMSTPRQINATFTRLCILTVASDGPGSATIQTPGGPRFRLGTIVTLKATPETSARFTHWNGAPINGSTNDEPQITVDADYALTARFGWPPTITAQPSSAAKKVGESVTFSVSATGDMPLTYTWKKDGNQVASGPDNSYTVASVALNHAGSYVCEVSNELDTAVSNTAVLAVKNPPANLRYDSTNSRHLVYGFYRNQPHYDGGTPTSYSVSPALPRGLTLDPSSGEISGNAQLVNTTRGDSLFSVTAGNVDGNTSCQIRIVVYGNLSTDSAVIGIIDSVNCTAMTRGNCTPKFTVENGRITEVHATQANGLPLGLGTVPPDIGNLTELKILDFADGRVDSLPAEIGNLSKLWDLRMHYSYSLKYIPPDIGDCIALYQVNLAYNLLEDLPVEITNLNLHYLDLAENKLCSANPPWKAWADTLDDDWASTQQNCP